MKTYPTTPTLKKREWLLWLLMGTGLAFLLLSDRAHAGLYASMNGGGAIEHISSAGVATTVATGLTHPSGLAFGSDGNLYLSQDISGSLTSTISKMTPGGTVTPFATGFQVPLGLAFDSAGNLFVADYATKAITKITSGGSVSSFATGLNSPFGLAFNSTGTLFVANRDNGTISQITTGGVISAFASGFNQPNDLTFGSGGNLYVSNFADNTISMVTSGGVVSTFVDNTHGLSAPVGLAYDPTTDLLYVANQGNSSIYQITSAGTVTSFATLDGSPQYLEFAPEAVPEPATIAVGLLCLGAGIARRRRIARAA